MMTRKIIKFTNTSPLELEPPKPGKNSIPDWFKQTPSYLGDKNEYSEMTRATIKKCIPVFDAIITGYLFTTPVDIWAKIEDGITYFYWKPNTEFTPVNFQKSAQAEKHPAQSKHPWKDVPKIINPWSIQTPKGYSCLILPPMHRETPFNTLPAIVDTDTYITPINFPFVLFDPMFTGLIPAGTPVAQIIPFKRDAWTLEISSNADAPLKQFRYLTTFFYNAYKNLMWSKKDFK